MSCAALWYSIVHGCKPLIGCYSWDRRNPYPWNSIPQTQNAHVRFAQCSACLSPNSIFMPMQFMKLQSVPHDSVFKPQAADDLRGRI